MKVKAKIIVDVSKKEIFSIEFNDRVLDTSNTTQGRIRLKKFFKKRVLQAPISEFNLVKDTLCPNIDVLETVVDVDIYPYIWKLRNNMPHIAHPYRCELFPYPVTKKNALEYKQYAEIHTEHLNQRSSKDYIL